MESGDDEFQETSRANKRLSRRERERDEEIREKLRKEIEEELQANKQFAEDGPVPQSTQLRFPLRTLTDDELNAVISSEDFLDFVDRSTKVIERALDEEYDVLADYEGGVNGEDDEEDEYGKKRRGIKEVAQFWDERWSKKRMISDLSFSPKVHSVPSHLTVIVPQLTTDTSSFHSFQSLFWLPIPRTPQPLMSPTAWCRSGTSICTLGQSTSSTRPPTSSPQNSLLSTRTSSWAVRTLAKSCYGTPAPRAQAEGRRCRKRP